MNSFIDLKTGRGADSVINLVLYSGAPLNEEKNNKRSEKKTRAKKSFSLLSFVPIQHSSTAAALSTQKRFTGKMRSCWNSPKKRGKTQSSIINNRNTRAWNGFVVFKPSSNSVIYEFVEHSNEFNWKFQLKRSSEKKKKSLSKLVEKQTLREEWRKSINYFLPHQRSHCWSLHNKLNFSSVQYSIAIILLAIFSPSSTHQQRATVLRELFDAYEIKINRENNTQQQRRWRRCMHIQHGSVLSTVDFLSMAQRGEKIFSTLRICYGGTFFFLHFSSSSPDSFFSFLLPFPHLHASLENPAVKYEKHTMHNDVGCVQNENESYFTIFSPLLRH